ncbi:endo alpha-1,4 polygalactosaminidase [Phycicoccus sp. CSK15P-2]|uniref:endo alpha-1,4 polygalactosaminidase n=1 Tax=Phycicoccus sp. CSK15P-2 TaxID=2807627 RepID=UPI001EF164F6|nr:endo alpha-1,4 polygalactosaminidase [Phycicoccus sp. CSK15P-2]
MRPRPRRLLTIVVALPLLAGCAGGASAYDAGGTSPAAPSVSPAAAAPEDAASSDGPTQVTLPPVGAGLDYQLGGASPVPDDVGVVVRDRTAPPAGDYAVCYVNGFQTQPDENDDWLRDHPELVLRDDDGEPVEDGDWGELLLDVRDDTRDGVLGIVGPWVRGCAEDGYDAVEIDNLDSWTRSDGLLTEDDAVETLTALARVAHGAGLAIGQKNAAEIISRLAGNVTDFAVVEECGEWDECGEFADAYDDHVLLVEYSEDGFDAACDGWAELRPVLRDRDLVPAGRPGYVRRDC